MQLTRYPKYCELFWIFVLIPTSSQAGRQVTPIKYLMLLIYQGKCTKGHVICFLQHFYKPLIRFYLWALFPLRCDHTALSSVKPNSAQLRTWQSPVTMFDVVAMHPGMPRSCQIKDKKLRENLQFSQQVHSGKLLRL